MSQIIDVYDGMVGRDGSPYKKCPSRSLEVINFKVCGYIVDTSNLTYKFCHGIRLGAYFMQLATTNYKDQHFNFQIGIEMQKMYKDQVKVLSFLFNTGIQLYEAWYIPNFIEDATAKKSSCKG